MIETYLLKIFYLILIRKGLATEKERDEIFLKLHYGMTMEEVYKVFDEHVKALEKSDVHVNVTFNEHKQITQEQADIVARAIVQKDKMISRF